MTRRFLAVVLTVLALTPLAAQAPKGWRLRIDRSTSASDPDGAGAIKFVAAGTGFRATNPQAATYWNPANTASGAYTLKATFTLLTPSSHTNYYGLVFGGSSLEGAMEDYTYFTVAQDGTWLLKRRTGESTPTLARNADPIVKRPDASGKSVNALEVRVMADKTDYVVNGKVVHSMPKSAQTFKTDGLYGFRVNHALDVEVDGLAVAK